MTESIDYEELAKYLYDCTDGHWTGNGKFRFCIHHYLEERGMDYDPYDPTYYNALSETGAMEERTIPMFGEFGMRGVPGWRAYENRIVHR